MSNQRLIFPHHQHMSSSADQLYRIYYFLVRLHECNGSGGAQKYQARQARQAISTFGSRWGKMRRFRIFRGQIRDDPKDNLWLMIWHLYLKSLVMTGVECEERNLDAHFSAFASNLITIDFLFNPNTLLTSASATHRIHNPQSTSTCTWPIQFQGKSRNMHHIHILCGECTQFQFSLARMPYLMHI